MVRQDISKSQVEMSNIPLPPELQRAHDETAMEKLVRKVKQEPLVPLGAFVTAGCLGRSAYHLRKGDSSKFNVWLRYRVLAQGLTVVALVYGAYRLGKPMRFMPGQHESEINPQNSLRKDIPQNNKNQE